MHVNIWNNEAADEYSLFINKLDYHDFHFSQIILQSGHNWKSYKIQWKPKIPYSKGNTRIKLIPKMVGKQLALNFEPPVDDIFLGMSLALWNVELLIL